MSEKKDFFSTFVDGVKEGYDQQEKEIERDKSNNLDKVKTGAATGATDGLINPFNWIKSLF